MAKFTPIPTSCMNRIKTYIVCSIYPRTDSCLIIFTLFLLVARLLCICKCISDFLIFTAVLAIYSIVAIFLLFTLYILLSFIAVSFSYFICNMSVRPFVYCVFAICPSVRTHTRTLCITNHYVICVQSGTASS